jgi:carbamoylphosphate synthase large subunit
MLVYGVTAAAPVDGDVATRVLTIEVDGEVTETRALPADATDLGEVKVARGASVVLALVDADADGNVSEPASFEFVATDTIPPAKPGEFGVALLRQED